VRPRLDVAAARLADWLAQGYHGEMAYMARHAGLRADPAALLPGARTVLVARMDYLPAGVRAPPLPDRAWIARYALGRDYHKTLRQRLLRLAERIAAEFGPLQQRACTDSAPLMEVEIACQGGLGWRGKHTLLLDRTGSWFFLGELLVDLDLPADPPVEGHCGRCTACIDACPTGAIVAPYVLDARRCIAYLTIEHTGPIPIELRPLLGHRVYGCDDCQIACPWNRFAQPARVADFNPRPGLHGAALIDLFAWSEAEFEARMAGSPIRRIGWERWLRNLAVALGNAPRTPAIEAALRARADHPSELVCEHVAWALGHRANDG